MDRSLVVLLVIVMGSAACSSGGPQPGDPPNASLGSASPASPDSRAGSHAPPATSDTPFRAQSSTSTGNAAPRATSEGAGGRIDILDKHFTIEAPAGHSHQRVQDGKGLESIIVFEAGNDPLPRFCLYAKELEMFGSGDIVADTVKIKGSSYRVTTFEGLPFPAAAIESIRDPSLPESPRRPEDDTNQMCVLELFIAHPDGSLQWLNFYILHKMRAELPMYRKKAIAVLKTLAPGAVTKARSHR